MFDCSPAIADRFSNLIGLMKKSLTSESGSSKLKPENDADKRKIDVIVQNLQRIEIYSQNMSQHSKRAVHDSLMLEMCDSMETLFDYIMNPTSSATFNEAVRLSKRVLDKTKSYTELIFKPNSKALEITKCSLLFSFHWFDCGSKIM